MSNLYQEKNNDGLLPDDKSFSLVVDEKHAKLFKIFLPTVLFFILLVASYHLFKYLFYLSYFLSVLATTTYVFYVYLFYKRNFILKGNIQQINDVSFIKIFKATDGRAISIAFYTLNMALAGMMFFARQPVLSLVSWLLALAAYSCAIIIKDLLAQRKLSVIEIITVFVVSTVYFIYRFKILERF